MLGEELTTIDKLSPAALMRKLGVDSTAEAQRNALSYVFHAVQGSFNNSGNSLEDKRKDTFDFLYENLELRSRVYEQFVDTIFPDHDPARRAALAVALICDEALRQAAKREDGKITFGGFDEDTIELALTFYEEAQDLAQHGNKAFFAGIEPESLFLAHINAIDALSVIESDYKDAPAKVLRDLEKNFFIPTSEILMDNTMGRHVASYMRAVQKIVHVHLSGYMMFGQYMIPDNDNP